MGPFCYVLVKSSSFGNEISLETILQSEEANEENG